MDRKQFSKGLAWTMVVNLINKAVFPIISIVITRLLGPGPLGAFQIIATILMISEIFRDAGLTQTFLADQNVDERSERTYMGLAIVMALIPALVLVASRDWLADVLQLPELGPSLLVVAFALACNGVATIPRAKLLRDARMRDVAIIDIISGGTGLFLTIGLVLLGFAFWSLVIQMVYCAVLTMALSLRAAPTSCAFSSMHEFGVAFRRTVILLAANALNNVFLFADVFVIRKLLGSTILLGLYGQGKNIAYKPADFVTFPLTRMLIVAFSKAAGEKERLCRVYAKSITATVLFVTPIYLLIGLNSAGVIAILLGSRYEGSAPILATMCVFLGFRTVGTVAGTALVSDGKSKLTLWPQVAGLAAGLILVWAMLPSIKGTQVTAETRRVEVGASAVTTVDQPERERRWLFFDFPQGNFGVDLVSVVGGTTEIVGDGLGQKDGPMNTRQLVALDPHVERNPDGYRFLKAHDQERLEKFVWAFTASAVVLYGLLIFLAARHFPLPAEERAKRRTAFGLALCTGVLLFLVSLVPLPPSLQFALACLVAPTFHIAGIGWAFEKNAKAYFSKAGAQRLWNTL